MSRGNIPIVAVLSVSAGTGSVSSSAQHKTQQAIIAGSAAFTLCERDETQNDFTFMRSPEEAQTAARDVEASLLH
jgi:hypothetical protein